MSGGFSQFGSLSHNIWVHSWHLVDRLDRAYIIAISAFDTIHLMDGVFFFTGTADAFHRTFASAERAANASIFIYIKVHEILTNLGRAAVITDVSFILIPEITDGRKHGIGSRLPQSA